MRRIAFAMLAWSVCLPALADDTLPAVDRRFAEETDEVPSFQRHVLPLLGRLGCNGRACHGSFQGQGGFRLSLFGYDFGADHAALLERTNTKSPHDSLLVRKPTLGEEHEGGQRFTKGSWQHRLLLRWIETEAAPVQEADPSFASIAVEPDEILFSRAGEARQIRVFATWSDGTREDVTPLCRFRTNDDSVAEVDETGNVSSLGPGDTHVVAFYDNGVAAIPVLRPFTDQVGARYPIVEQATKVDALVVAKLSKLGILPSELCTDAEFLRRVSLDLTGTLPAPEEVEAFLADDSANKRTAKIDELLQRPAYAAWWATRLCDLTGNSSRTGPQGGEQNLNDEKSRQWYRWIQRRIAANKPYDKIVEGIVLAVGKRSEQSFDEYCEEMSSYFRRENPADFAARDTMPYFWSRRNVGKADDKALSFAFAFLGVSLQCAQCHKHPFDQWTKQDFDQFTAFFNGVRYGVAARDQVEAMKREVGLTGDEDSGAFKRSFQQLLQEGKRLPFKDVSVPLPSKTAKRRPASTSKLGRVITPKLLGGEEVIATDFADPRQPLMDWMRQPDNPYFARSLVNRVWAVYFHAGLIEPTDDLNLANPPSNAALLDYLEEGFVKSGYDLKWLHRTIANSHAYQRSWRPNETNRLDERNYSRAVVRRLPAEVVVDAMVLATASRGERRALDEDPAQTRAIGAASGLAGRNVDNYAVNLFGKPPRQINCECERASEPTLLQTVFLRNDQEVWQRLRSKTGWLAEIGAGPQLAPQVLARIAYLRTLSRPPNTDELAIAVEHLNNTSDQGEALRLLLWALMNTKEFVLNH